MGSVIFPALTVVNDIRKPLRPVMSGCERFLLISCFIIVLFHWINERKIQYDDIKNCNRWKYHKSSTHIVSSIYYHSL